jgi:hypothetical protein
MRNPLRNLASAITTFVALALPLSLALATASCNGDDKPGPDPVDAVAVTGVTLDPPSPMNLVTGGGAGHRNGPPCARIVTGWCRAKNDLVLKRLGQMATGDAAWHNFFAKALTGSGSCDTLYNWDL